MALTFSSPTLQAVASVLSSSPTQQRQLLPVLLSFATDAVPNLRFNLAKALEKLAPSLADEPALVASAVKPALTSLLQDRDDDVRYYSRRALAAFPADAT